jgi:O-antigen/teichoic acid export membrane protein
MSRNVVAAAQFALGNVLALLVGVYTTLVLPRQLAVLDFADWRLFVLYASFVGVLHAGALDALVFRWSRRGAGAPLPASLRPLLTLVVLWQAALLAAWWPLRAHVPPAVAQVGTAVLAFGLVWNVATAVQYALQAQRRFLACAVFTATNAAVFAIATAVGAFRHGWITAEHGYVLAATLATAVVLLPTLGVRGRWRPVRRDLQLVRVAVVRGLPLLFVNLAVIVLASADRLAVSAGFPREQFAIYAFAASLLAIAHSLINVAARFLVPFVTRWVREGRFDALHARLLRLIAGAWAVMAGGLVAAGPLVIRWFPRYEDALPIAIVMTLAVPFTAAIQLVHLNYSRVAARSAAASSAAVGALAWAAALLAIAVTASDSLLVVAAAGVGIMVGWWTLGVLFVLPRTTAAVRVSVVFALGVAALATVVLACAGWGTSGRAGATLLCLAAAAYGLGGVVVRPARVA